MRIIYYNSLASDHFQFKSNLSLSLSLMESIPSPRPIRAKYFQCSNQYFIFLCSIICTRSQQNIRRGATIARTEETFRFEAHRLTQAKIIQWVGGTLAKGRRRKEGVKRRGNYYHWNLWWHRDYPFSVFTAAQLQETIITLARVSCFAIPLCPEGHTRP